MLTLVQNDTICIIGNGFDVAHGLPSKYSDFKKWLLEHNRSLYDTLNYYIDLSGDWWNEFERNLAEFHLLKLIDEAPRDYHPPQDLRLPPFPYYPASSFFRTIREQIKDSFTMWARSLSCETSKQIIDLPNSNLYISFNYTDTLEKIYGISDRRILYIHGKASSGNKLVFGHHKTHFELEEDLKRKYNLYESNSFFEPGTFGDAEFQLTLEISYLDKFPYGQLVEYKDILIPALISAKKVWVFGWAFSEVDYQYIEWFVDRNPNLFWKVSWHTEKDKAMVISIFHSLGFRNYELFYA